MHGGMRVASRAVRGSVVALLAGAMVPAALLVTPGAAQSGPPACTYNDGAVIDAKSPVAYQRSTPVRVTATTPDAGQGTFTITARDPAHPIAHPASVSYSALAKNSIGEGTYSFHAERGDGDAVAAFTWTTTENGTSCQAQVRAVIRVIAGELPRVMIVHEHTRKVFFSVERPECVSTAIVPLAIEVRGPGGRVRQAIGDACGTSFHRTGRNPNFALTARDGVVTFVARRLPHTYRATYRVLVNNRVAVSGAMRVVLVKGRPIVVISIHRA